MALINPVRNFEHFDKAFLRAGGLFSSVFFIGWLLCLSCYGQQTFSYTQYMNNLTPINSTASLMDDKANFDMLARKQWAGVDGAPTTLFFDGNLQLAKTKASAGLIVENDKFGVENLTEINAFYAQGVEITDDHFLAVSFNLGYKNYVANYTQLDPNDPALSPDIKENKPNVGFGIMYYSKNFYLGVSVPQLTIRNLGQASLLDNNYFRNNYFFTGGFTLQPMDGIKFKPAALVSYTRGVPLITDVSAMLVIKDLLGVGVNYRTNNDAAIIVSMDFSSFRIGYSYQLGVTASNIGGYSNATQEITIGFRFDNKKSPQVNIQRQPKIF